MCATSEVPASAGRGTRRGGRVPRHGGRWAPVRARRLAVAAILAGGVAAPGPTAGQVSPDSLAALCVATTGPEGMPLCREAALAFQAVHGATGLAAAGGNDLPGAASTLGRRFGTVPRVSLALRGRVTAAPLPEATGAPPAEEITTLIPSAHASVTVGLFDGFSLLPTVGGLFSVDLTGGGDVLFLRGEDGFDGAVTALAVGGRVGILRESFTLPGISVSAARRWVADVVWTDPAVTGRAGADTDPVVTSLRGVVGKDLLALGFLAGAGWDRYEASGRLVLTEEGTTPRREIEVADFRAERLLVFGGVSLNFLVLQLAAEGGWAQGFDEVGGRAPLAYDPAASSFFGSVSFRLTL